MQEFQLYKRRDLSAYITDTTQFFKLLGKDFMRNFAIINGALLLVIAVIYYFFYSNVMSSITQQAINGTNWLMSDNNGVYVALFFLIFMIVSVIYGIMSVSFPATYLKLYAETGRDKFSASEIFDEIKTSFFRVFLFGLISMFIAIPVIAITMALGIGLSLILIGLPILFLGIPAIIVWFTQALYIYLYKESGYFESLGKAWKILFGSFWNITGSTLVVLVIGMILSSIFSLIPTLTTMGATLTSGSNPVELLTSPLMIIMNTLNLIFGSVFYNVIYIHQGLIYFSSIESTESHQALSDIDNIGKNEE